MKIELMIRSALSDTLKELYSIEPSGDSIQIQSTRKDFNGDLTLVVFPFLRYSRKSPEATAQEIGNHLLERVDEVKSFNVVKGFLNLEISDLYWIQVLQESWKEPDFGFQRSSETPELVMVEYSSPNTNKPLHLGHIRNNLLGFSIAEILKAGGYRVVKTNIVNDRGIHICKSMQAWIKWGKGQTPENSGKKGDHLVGELYVEFNTHVEQEIADLVKNGLSRQEAENQAPSLLEARELLRKWESGVPDVVQLWKTMNSWVYKGFDETYQRLGVDFDQIYYESETYLVGKEEVLRGLKENIFYAREDGSVWADLTPDGLDQKLLLRSDGTSVYMTQDIGTAKMRYNDYPVDKMVYVVGNEQNYHFQVLAVLLDRLGFEWGKNLYHFSYGMVELPSGKMKSREGKVVDADDLIDDMVKIAGNMAKELGKLDGIPEEEARKIHEMIALGALKYFILKVDPKKNMLFNPEESIDFNGNTGPFIQYTHARIKSVLRKAAEKDLDVNDCLKTIPDNISVKEKDLLKRIASFPDVVKESGLNYSPALIANYCFELAKEYNQFYHDHPILAETNKTTRNIRLLISAATGKVIKKGMKLLGIDVPERM
ncbi:MAG: arginine--tRNA ligase [Mariniphaga sp.]|nr:arginine--tRNA ligase [Mariniphaga sp.]MDD4225047.1 arginine--tRNA ligase [Mariniphaga sp.]